MCSFDCDPCEVFVTRLRKARLPHVCDVCSARIPAGDAYHYSSWIFDGTAASGKACWFCAIVLHEFTRSHGSAPTVDWFRDALHDCFDGADKHDPDAAAWRSAMAGILWREREAARG